MKTIQILLKIASFLYSYFFLLLTLTFALIAYIKSSFGIAVVLLFLEFRIFFINRKIAKINERLTYYDKQTTLSLIREKETQGFSKVDSEQIKKDLFG